MADLELTGGPLELPKGVKRWSDIFDQLEPAMKEIGYLLQNEMAEYPKQRPTSYRRTGTLGRGWTSKTTKTPSFMEVVVGNRVKYAPFVQSSRFQNRFHRGHWQTDVDVLKRNEKKIVSIFRNRLNSAFGGK